MHQTRIFNYVTTTFDKRFFVSVDFINEQVKIINPRPSKLI